MGGLIPPKCGPQFLETPKKHEQQYVLEGKVPHLLHVASPYCFCEAHFMKVAKL